MAPRVLVVREARTTIAPSVLSELRRRFEIEVTVAICESEIENYDLVLFFEDAGLEQSFELEGLAGARRGENVIVLQERPSVAGIVRALRSGVAAVLPSVDDAGQIVQTCEDVLSNLRLRDALGRLEAESAPVSREAALHGDSPAVEELRRGLRVAAASDLPVLITGEAGSGKTRCARVLHAQSASRAHAPFVALGPGAPELAESEDFFDSGFGGTLFVSDVAELPFELQAKLLRALERLESRAGEAGMPRLVAATSRELSAEVGAGRFVGGLFAKLEPLSVTVPPLRERGHDVLTLAYHFLRSASSPARRLMGLTPLAAMALLNYPWPGNVRELEQCIRSAAAIARYDLVREIDLPRHVASLPGDTGGTSEIDPLSDIEREHVLTVLRSVRGNKTRASRLLGVDRKTLYRKLESYGLISELRPRVRATPIVNVRGPNGSA
jgi:DNA-binding NtrC family response regulator